jgi:predicted nucleic acid-binding protein
MRPKPSAQVVVWIERQPITEVCTTSITEAEIFYGIELLTKGKRRDGLLAVAEAIFADDFRGRIFDFDSQAARAYSRIAAHRRALGKPISHPDAQIAAIAQRQGLRSRRTMLPISKIAIFPSLTRGECETSSSAIWPRIPAKSSIALCVYWRRKSTWAGAFELLHWAQFDRPRHRGCLRRWRRGSRHPHRRGWVRDLLARTSSPSPQVNGMSDRYVCANR